MSPTTTHPWAPDSASKTDLGAVIDSKELTLADLHRHYLRSRWLEQVLRIENEVKRAVNRHYALRLTTVIGSLLILVLVSFESPDPQWAIGARYATISLALFVSISVALEQIFNYGERRRQSERRLERLKTEGWRFLQLSGHYRRYATHAEAFPTFANQIEDLSQREVEVYMTEVVIEREPEAHHAGTNGDAAANTLQLDIPVSATEKTPAPSTPQTSTTRAALRDLVANRAHRHQAR